MLIERIAELRKQAVLAKTGLDGSQPERFVLTPNELLAMLDAYVKVHGPGR